MKRLWSFVLGALALIGALLASFAASRKYERAHDEEVLATTLKRNNQLRAAAEHADKAQAYRNQAKDKRKSAEKRIDDAAKRDPVFADVADRFNAGMRRRTDRT